MERKPFRRALWIITLAAGLVLIYPAIHYYTPFLKHHFRSYDPLGPLFSDSTATDSLQGIPDRDSLQASLYKYDGREYLAPFYRALRAGHEQVRIAHYGDSSIEGDLITASFRDSLQRRFGGSGIGFVPILDPIAGFRRTVIHTFSDDWHHQPLQGDNEQSLPYGISGDYFSSWQPADSMAVAIDTLPLDEDSPASQRTFWTFYRTADIFPGIRTFPQSRLFYGAVFQDSTAQEIPAPSLYVEAGGVRKELILNTEAPVNQYWLQDNPLQQIYLRFEVPPSLPLYGLSFETPDGIIVDNFPSRGNSGIALRRIKPSTLRAFQSMLDYDLIMLQFGLNALNPEMEDYGWYERQMEKVLSHFREAMPGITLLILGPSDRAIRYKGQLRTDPSVPRITEALRRTAERNEVAFFSFFEAMGGEGSMVRWVDRKEPRLANLDYTHFNFAGARRASGFLLEFLLQGYERYERGELVEDPIGARIPEARGEVTLPSYQNPER